MVLTSSLRELMEDKIAIWLNKTDISDSHKIKL